MMKKKIFITGALTLFFFSLVSFAQGVRAVTPEGVLPPLREIIGDQPRVRIPEGKFQEKVIPSTISIMLQLAGSIAFIVFTVAGIILVVAHGNEELQTKAKNIFLYAILGLTIIALSYAIIYGVFTLKFE